MSGTRKILIGLAVVVVLGAAAAISMNQRGDEGIEVRVEEVTRRDLVATVTASGNIRPRRMVDISADVMGRIVELTVREGDPVERGDVLLRIDPTQYEAALSRSRAGLSQSRANAAQSQANYLQAQRELDRLTGIVARDSALISRQQVEDAQTAVEVQRALNEAAEFGVEQAQAAVEEAEDQLEKTIIRAPMSGIVTRLSVEEGEMAVIGTMNNPGSLLLTVSDLSVVEAVMQIDETNVPEISLGDSAVVELDAFPGETFTGRVTEIGNSAIVPPSQVAGTGQTAAIDFEVVITLDAPPEQIRPDLSASADVITDVRDRSLSIPIIALTIREEDRAREEDEDEEERPVRAGSRGGPSDRPDAPVEGVFKVIDGTVEFVPVEVGIAGREHFEVISGLEEGDVVVSGPYQRIRALTNGDLISVMEEGEGEDGGNRFGPTPSGR
jgi:HlyD family secretion protein